MLGTEILTKATGKRHQIPLLVIPPAAKYMQAWMSWVRLHNHTPGVIADCQQANARGPVIGYILDAFNIGDPRGVEHIEHKLAPYSY